MHLVISNLLKSSGAAALINNLLWILFFTIKAPYDVFNLIIRRNLAIYLCIVVVITVFIITLIVMSKSKLQRLIIFKILSVFWLVIFMFNAVPAFVYTIRNHSTHIAYEINYKIEFNVDNNLPSPNIYWLLMDGMLGFKAMEHLFNDPQPEFTAQLTERGFIINRDAQYEALHLTLYCIPALMCPTYYDIYFTPKLLSHYFIDKTDKKDQNRRGNELKESATLARVKNELILAFNKKGYHTSSIFTTFPDIYYFSPNVLYLNNKKFVIKEEKKIILIQEKYIKLFYLFSLFIDTTPLSRIAFIFDKFMNQYIKYHSLADIQEIPNQPMNVIKSFFGESYQGNDRWYLSALADNMDYSGPKLVIIHDMKTHSPFMYDKQGNRISQNFDPHNYPSQHYFASAIVISYIDFILNADPEAIIIIQSDHGLHNVKTQSQLISKYAKNNEDVKIMQNQTISAVRIPEKWGGLEQPVEPPNITRLLVNRYVGENYEILASEDIVK